MTAIQKLQKFVPSGLKSEIPKKTRRGGKRKEIKKDEWIRIRATVQMKKRLKDYADERELTMSVVVDMAIKEFISKKSL